MTENHFREDPNITSTTQEMMQKNLAFIELLIAKLHIKSTQESQIKIAEVYVNTSLEFNKWLQSIPNISISNLSDREFDIVCAKIIESNSLQLCVSLNLPRNLIPIIKCQLFEIIRSIVKLNLGQKIISNSELN